MKRIHAFEIEDQSWCPALFRNFLTDFLLHSVTKLKVYDSTVMPLVSKMLKETNSKQIVDLCSGAAGPCQNLAYYFQDTSIVLTDKYPNLESFKTISEKTKGQISFVSESVDATNVPQELSGMRTVFTGFHHFKPDMAKAILKDAVDKKTPIAIFEFNERSWKTALHALNIPLIVLLLTPSIKPFKLSRLFWTYVIPVLPLMIFWDGFISNLRVYSVKELEKLTGSLESSLYKWEIGQNKSPLPGVKVTYLLGYPISEDDKM